MMGTTHAASGAVLFLAVQPLLASHGWIDPGMGTVIAGTVAAAGSGMLPDIDHHEASIAQSLGPVTKGITYIVSAISGGHRNGTHSLVGVVVLTALGYAGSRLTGWPLGLVLGFLVAIGLAGLRVKVDGSWVVHTLLVIAATVVFCLSGAHGWVDMRMLPWAVCVGCVAHILGDMLTKEGCPLIWPFSKKRFRILCLTTGQTGEKIVAALLWIVGIGLCLWRAGLIAWSADIDWNSQGWIAWLKHLFS